MTPADILGVKDRLRAIKRFSLDSSYAVSQKSATACSGTAVIDHWGSIDRFKKPNDWTEAMWDFCTGMLHLVVRRWRDRPAIRDPRKGSLGRQNHFVEKCRAESWIGDENNGRQVRSENNYCDCSGTAHGSASALRSRRVSCRVNGFDLFNNVRTKHS